MEVGWLLDGSIDRESKELVLWIKSNGKTQGYPYPSFKSSLFVDTDLLRNNEWEDSEVLHATTEHEEIVETRLVKRYLSVYEDTKKEVVQVFTQPGSHWEVAKDLEQLPGATVYHTDINPIQQFFITQEVFPFGKVEYDCENSEIVELKNLDNREAVHYEIPDLEEVELQVSVSTKHLFPRMEDPIHHIRILHRGHTEVIEEADEKATLLKLQQKIDEIDPDIIITRGGDEKLFRYLSLRARIHEVELLFSRDGTPLNVKERNPQSFWQYNRVVYRSGRPVMFNGRIHIDRNESMYYSPSGIEGVAEGCRLASAQPQRVARMSIGSVNAAVQYYNAYKRGLLIPPIKKNPEFLKSVNDLATIDRGGLIFQPKPDIYEKVAECDFSSMYPTLMVTRNISPETICMRNQCPYNHKYCADVPGVNFRICERRRGLVSKSLELVIQKRKAFKKLIKEGEEANKYRLMQNTLKGILVSCFGYLGFKNARFGRVEAHTAVTAFARETLLQTQEIGERYGFEIIHGIVDSLWLTSKKEIEYDQVQKFCKEVTDVVDIPMSMKGIYKWFVIPSSRVKPSIAPLNRYYGLFRNGSIKTRGIEVRRRDTCLYVGDCQNSMIQVLAQARDKREFLDLVPEAFGVCQDYITKLREGDVDMRDLVLNSRLSREPEEYRTTSRAAVVAKQLVEMGKDLHAGQKVRYVLIESDTKNPMKRVKAIELLDESVQCDFDAYANLCLRAFESLVPAKYVGLNNPEAGKQLRSTEHAIIQ
ncbi:MAG: DNA polymerase domain-containing protein [Candidatus Thorarchaeota archaeon]